MVSHLIVTQDGTVVGSTIDTTVIATLASLLVPLLVSFITKQTASDGLRSIVNIVAAGVVAALALWINPSDAPVTWQLVVNTMLASFVASISAYKGIWKPTGVTGSITARTPSLGLGRPPLQTHDVDAEEG